MSGPSEREAAEQHARLSRLVLNVANLLTDVTRLKKRRGANDALLGPCLSKIEAALNSIKSKDEHGAKQSLIEARKLLKELQAKMLLQPKTVQ
jgi:hypothetical protein